MTGMDMYHSIVLSAAVRRAIDLRKQEREELADLITDKVVAAWNKGQKKGPKK